jgi:hypothetical protein
MVFSSNCFKIEAHIMQKKKSRRLKHLESRMKNLVIQQQKIETGTNYKSNEIPKLQLKDRISIT